MYECETTNKFEKNLKLKSALSFLFIFLSYNLWLGLHIPLKIMLGIKY